MDFNVYETMIWFIIREKHKMEWYRDTDDVRIDTPKIYRYIHAYSDVLYTHSTRAGRHLHKTWAHNWHGLVVCINLYPDFLCLCWPGFWKTFKHFCSVWVSSSVWLATWVFCFFSCYVSFNFNMFCLVPLKFCKLIPMAMNCISQ